MAGLGRSASGPSLMQAGSSMTHAHIPKRATQHGCFLSSSEAQQPELKPGQMSLERNVYAEEARDLSETYVTPDKPVPSVYGTTYIGKSDHYKNPTRPIRQSEPSEYCGHRGTGHWRSTYKSTHDPASIDGAVYHRQTGPSYQASNPPTCVGRGPLQSTFSEFHGTYGSDPRSKVGPNDKSMPVFKTTLTPGTAKGTFHIPGYQGFLATNTSNPHVARVASGVNIRGKESSLTDQFHVNTLNYSGHVPTNPNNDRGGVKVNVESTFGKSFRTPPLNAFPPQIC